MATSLAMWCSLLMHLVIQTAAICMAHFCEAEVLCRAELQMAAEETLQALRNANDALIELNSEASSSIKQDKKSKGDVKGREVRSTTWLNCIACPLQLSKNPSKPVSVMASAARMSSTTPVVRHSPQQNHTESRRLSLSILLALPGPPSSRDALGRDLQEEREAEEGIHRHQQLLRRQWRA